MLPCVSGTWEKRRSRSEMSDPPANRLPSHGTQRSRPSAGLRRRGNGSAIASESIGDARRPQPFLSTCFIGGGAQSGHGRRKIPLEGCSRRRPSAELPRTSGTAFTLPRSSKTGKRVSDGILVFLARSSFFYLLDALGRSTSARQASSARCADIILSNSTHAGMGGRHRTWARFVAWREIMPARPRWESLSRRVGERS
jgi:hypothetical protein